MNSNLSQRHLHEVKCKHPCLRFELNLSDIFLMVITIMLHMPIKITLFYTLLNLRILILK